MTQTAPTTAKANKTNDIRHVIDINDSENNIKIKIRLNDECNNGHQDFSITGDYWQVGAGRSERTNLGGGCIHEAIVKARPDLQIFVSLHLCDYTGVPMHGVANGFYHLKNGFNSTKPTDKGFRAEFCEYYRMTAEQFEQISLCENEMRYAIKLESLGVLKQWKAEADRGIKLLEEWTNSEFVIDSVRTQYTAPTPAQRKEEEKKEREGYYTPAKIKARQEAKKRAEIEKQYKEIEKDRDADTSKAQLEYQAKKAVLDAGMSLENFIFYSHSKEGVFNWKNYGEQVSEEEFKNFIRSGNLVKGVTFKLGKEKK